MKTKKLSDGVLVYDRYFSTRPIPGVVLLKKILICCGLAVSAMMFILTDYALPVALLPLAAITAFAAIISSLLFVFVRRRYILPSAALSAAIIAYANWQRLAERISYIADAFLLLSDGRFLHADDFLAHPRELLVSDNPSYCGSVFFASALVCIVFAVVTAAAFAKRVRVLPSAICIAVLSIPRLLSEKLEFNLWFVPLVFFGAAAAAVSVSYRGGLAVGRGGNEYAGVLSAEEREFSRAVRRADYRRRISMNAVHYSKYFSVGICCAAVFALTATAGALVFPRGSSIDYSAALKALKNIADDRISTSPFENGPVSRYFSHEGERETADDISIIAPGDEEQEIIRVTYEGTEPLYLRGDIGIDFSGTGWSSPVASLPKAWKDSGLSQSYRPCEGRVIHTLLDAGGYEPDEFLVADVVNIDYLCDTSVVFLPAYTAEFSYYTNEMFNVFGDFAVRVCDEYGNVNSVQCTAIIPRFTNCDDKKDSARFEQLMAVLTENNLDVNRFYRTAVPEMSEFENVLDDYRDYVFEQYTRIPTDVSEELQAFMRGEGIAYERISDEEQRSRQSDIYNISAEIADFLRENYTYSLSADIDEADPVMSFLKTTKQGHCALYASAMTLMLRNIGIPARYCTGFMVDGSRGTVVTLKAKNLHAWCEVYVCGYGWVTFDPTSSSVFSEELQNPATPVVTTTSVTEEQHPQTTPASPEESTPEASSPQTTPTAPQTPQKEIPRISPELLAIIISAAAVVIALCVFGWYVNHLKKRAEKRLMSFHSEDSASAAETMYSKLLEILRLYKITPQNGELPADFFRRADKQFGTRLSEDTELLEQLAFAERGARNADREHLHIHLKKLFRVAVKRKGLLRKIRLYKILLK